MAPADVFAHRAALTDVAVLLTRADQDAGAWVTAALVRLRPGADRPNALRVLLQTRAPARVWQERADPWWVAPAQLAAARRTAGTLAAMAPDQRAAVVLVDGAGLDAAELDRVLPRAVPTRELAAARAALGPDPARALSELLAVQSALVPVDDDLTAEVRCRRWWRRARPALAAAGVAAVVGAVLVTRSGGTPDAAPLSGARGTLAVDPGVLADALELPWPTGVEPSDLRVDVATDELGSRWILLVGTTGVQQQAAWFTGPAGTPVPLLTAVGVQRGDVGRPLALATPTGLLVAASPQDSVGLSWSPDPVSGDRSFTGLPVRDGLAVAAPDQAGRTGSAAVLRVDHAGGSADLRPLLADPRVPVALPRLQPPSAGGTPEAYVRDAAVTAVATRAGLDPVVLVATTVWSGQFDSGPAGEVDAVLVVVTLPRGAVVTSTAFAQAREGQAFLLDGCGIQLTAPVVAARCRTGDPATGRTAETVVVLGLTAVAQLLTRDGDLVADVPASEAAVVTVRDDGGTGAVVRSCGRRTGWSGRWPSRVSSSPTEGRCGGVPPGPGRRACAERASGGYLPFSP